MNYTWIKLYTEALDDPKMARLPDGLWRLAVELMMMAGKEGEEGVLPPLADMAWSLRRRDAELEEDLGTLSQAIGLAYDLKLGRWVLTHFSERQAALTSTERMRKLRGSNPAMVIKSKEIKDAPPPSESALPLKNVTEDVTKSSQKRHTTCDENVTEEEKKRKEKNRKEEEKKRVEQSSPARATHAGVSRSSNALASSPLRGSVAAVAVAVGDPHSGDERDDRNVFKIYAENVAELTPPREHWIKTKISEYGADEVITVITEAVMSNVVNHRYMDAILIRRQNDRDKPPEPADEVAERPRLAERIIPPDPWAHLKDGVKTPLPGKTTLEPRYSGIRRR